MNSKKSNYWICEMIFGKVNLFFLTFPKLVIFIRLNFYITLPD